MIILEGPDLCGKSTLAQKLHNLYGYKIVKCSAPKQDDDVYREYVGKILMNRQFTTFDRMFIGELVYGPLKRGVSQLDDNKILNLTLLLQARNCQVINCSASNEFIEKAFKIRGESFVTLNEIFKIKSLYKNVMKSVNLPIYDYNCPSKFPIEVVACNKRFVVPKFIQQSRYVGSLKPDIVFVGWRNNTNATPTGIELPFDFGKSANVLKEVIKLSGVKNYGITNVVKHWLNEDVNMIYEELDYLDPERIICLGDDAYAAVKRNFKQAIKIHHPSYVARFKRTSIKNYANLIKRLC